jgi:hypothetical protein
VAPVVHNGRVGRSEEEAGGGREEAERRQRGGREEAERRRLSLAGAPECRTCPSAVTWDRFGSRFTILANVSCTCKGCQGVAGRAWAGGRAGRARRSRDAYFFLRTRHLS